MEARVKKNCPYSQVRAHAGHDYNKKEWRPVPDNEAPALLLEYREAPQPDVQETVPDTSEHVDDVMDIITDTELDNMSDRGLRDLCREKGFWKRGMPVEVMKQKLRGN